MKHIDVRLDEKSYKIFVGSGAIKEIGKIIHSHKRHGKKIVIITNRSIRKYYGKNVQDSLESAGFNTFFIEVADGESAKSLQEVEMIYSKLIASGADRSTILAALGGGVIGDMTGFAAATYMRGVPYIQVPTSLLAMTDSSVGGKTGVNLHEGKNLVGAFYQPAGVFIDTDTLSTLPADELRAGLAEVVKYGVIADKNFFQYIENHIDDILRLDSRCLKTIIVKSCAIKAGVVEKDEREENLRAILNFGHTFGHAVESLTGYKTYKHGEAVSIGMVFASLLSLEMGMCGVQDCERIKRLLKEIGLPVEFPELKAEDVIDCIYHDKKVIEEKIRFILMKGIGEVEIVEDIPVDMIKEVLRRKGEIEKRGMGETEKG